MTLPIPTPSEDFFDPRGKMSAAWRRYLAQIASSSTTTTPAPVVTLGTVIGYDGIVVDGDLSSVLRIRYPGSHGGTTVVVSDTPPDDPQNGQPWVDTTDGTLYIWYDDGTSASWVAFGVAGGGAAASDITYDHTTSGLAAIDVQAALDEVVASIAGGGGGGGGGTITDWSSTTLTITATSSNPTKGTTTADAIYWRRVGDSMEIRIDYQQSGGGSAGSGNYLFLIPDGKTIDTTKIRVYTGGAGSVASIGTGTITDQASYNRNICVTPYDTHHVRFGDFSVGYVGSANANLTSGATTYTASFTVPIVEWA